VHAPHVQREEAGAASGQGHEHRGDHVRGRPQPPLREAHGSAQPHPQAAPDPLPVLIFHSAIINYIIQWSSKACICMCIIVRFPLFI
jgi:hypothetical protein